MHIFYGTVLIALGCWATFTTLKTVTSHDWRTTRRTLGLLGVAFVASCFLAGLAMLAGMFEPWMLIPLGGCYLVLIPFPCYLRWANHGWRRIGRSALFLLVGAGLIAAGLDLLPVSWFGL